MTCKPFLKWAGGKRALARAIAHHLPEHIRCYHEPFLGGGAVFFHVHRRVHRAVLSDANEDLVNCYKCVRDEVCEVIDELERYECAYRRDPEDHYYHVRREPGEPGTAQEAARFIFLNKTCFNGLYRVNKDGGFNVPWGRSPRKKIVDKATLLAASAALQKAEVKHAHYHETFYPFDELRGAAIYCDPPYDGTFSDYTSEGFGFQGQLMLACFADTWSRHCPVLVSNADTPLTRSIYPERNYRRVALKAARRIGGAGASRADVMEALFVSKTAGGQP